MKAVMVLPAGATMVGRKRGSAVPPVIVRHREEATEKQSSGPVILEHMQFCTASRATVYIMAPVKAELYIIALFLSIPTLCRFVQPARMIGIPGDKKGESFAAHTFLP